MNFNETIGNANKSNILRWFNKGKPEKNVLIIQGNSGNGKTLLPTLLADIYNHELQLVTPDTINNDTALSFNQSTSGKKLILFDSFDEVKPSDRSVLYDAISLSVFPIIVTITEWVLKPEIFKHSTYMRMRKPLSTELIPLLKKNNPLSLPLSTIEDIATQSNNIMQALNAMQNGIIPTRTPKPLITKERLSSLQQRKFSEPITIDNVHYYYNTIQGYNNESIQTMIHFSTFDYLTKTQYQTIDPLIINNIVSLNKTIIKPYQKKFNPKPQPKPNPKPKQEKNKQVGIDLYF